MCLDATSVSANSERREHVGINANFESASGNNNTLGESNVNDETLHNIPDQVIDLSVPETHFDRQAPTHHTTTKFSTYFSKLLKNEITVLSLILRRFPHLSIEPLISTILGNIDSTGRGSKIRNPKYLSD